MTPSDNSFTISPHNLALLHSTLLHSYPVPLSTLCISVICILVQLAFIFMNVRQHKENKSYACFIKPMSCIVYIILNLLLLCRTEWSRGWKDWGGMMAPLEISAVDCAIAAKICTMVGSVWCNLQDCIFRFSKISFFYFMLIMLIYANQ